MILRETKSLIKLVHQARQNDELQKQYYMWDVKIRSSWFIHGMRLTRANPHSQMEAARSMRREKPKASTQSLALYWRCSVVSVGQHGSFQASLCKFTSLQKVAADKRMSGFPSQNLRHHALYWCISRCLIAVFLCTIWWKQSC